MATKRQRVKFRAKGEQTLRVLALPADTNAAGNVFGGWVLAQIDAAAGIRGCELVGGAVVTAAVRELSFAQTAKAGDVVSFYTELVAVGRSSMTLGVEAWAQRFMTNKMDLVAHGTLIVVAVDAKGRPRRINITAPPTLSAADK